MSLKLAVIGSRTFDNYELLVESIKGITKKDKPFTHIVSGGAKGADKLGEQYAKEYKLETIIYYPNWQKYGKAAGFIRNEDIIKEADEVIAFWDGQSRGTLNSINHAKKQKKLIHLIHFGQKPILDSFSNIATNTNSATKEDLYIF